MDTQVVLLPYQTSYTQSFYVVVLHIKEEHRLLEP